MKRLMSTGQVDEIWWHVHHDVLAEPLTEPVEARREYIRTDKPEAERETRLRLLRPVLGPLPPAVDRARAELARARAEWDRAHAELVRAREERDRVIAEWDRALDELDHANAELAHANAELAHANAELAHVSDEWDHADAELDRARDDLDRAYDELARALRSQEMSALHAAECPGCPWDGRTIFPGSP